MIEVQVRERHVGDVLRPHSQGSEVAHERPGALRVGVGTDANVDQHGPRAVPDEEPTHLEGEHAIRIKELLVGNPVLFVWPVEHQGRRSQNAAIGHAIDGDVADLHDHILAQFELIGPPVAGSL